MKFYIILFTYLFSSLFLFSQKKSLKINLNAENTHFKILKSKDNLEKFRFVNTISNFDIFIQKNGIENFGKILIENYTSHNDFGSPAIPVTHKLIEIPQNAEIQINIISYDEEIINLNELGFSEKIFPRQAPISKSIKPEDLKFFFNKEIYKKDEFFSNELANIEVLGMMRGTQIGRLSISPFQYNPVKNILKVWNNLIVEVVFKNSDFSKTKELKRNFYSPYFSKTFENNLDYHTKDLMTTYPIKYVIISDRMFEESLQPFIRWKEKKGFHVITAYTDEEEVGNTTNSIKTYLQSLYESSTIEDPAPSFVLFVGDVGQVPSWSGTTGSHVTDLYYCEYTDDFFPEVYYGRFSANNVDELEPQIEKTLQYEKYTMPDPSYLNDAVLVAGADASFAPTHGNGQINYGVDNYFNEEHGFNTNAYLYPESESSSSEIIQNVSDGVGFGNYTAHCGPSGWSSPSFETFDLANLQNSDKYGLLIGNCCLSNKFEITECFGEALLRANKKGAVGYIGASNNTTWDEDFYWSVGVRANINANPIYNSENLGLYDCAFHENNEEMENWYITQGQMIYSGNLAVTASGSSQTNYYWEIYHLMGDPSVMTYLTEPEILSISYNQATPVGTNNFTVNTEANTYVAISFDGVLLDAKLSNESGIVNLYFDAFTTPGTADIVATKQNRQVHIGEISIIPADGAFCSLSSFEISDENGLAETGETINLSVELSNVGMEGTTGVNATLNTDNEYIIIENATANFGSFDASSNVNILDAYTFNVANNVPDGELVIFSLDIIDENNNSWTSNFTITLKAPNLLNEFIEIDDSENGNNNGRLDNGETVSLKFRVTNNGHSDAENIICNLSSQNPYITINENETTISNLGEEQIALATFYITVGENVPSAYVSNFIFTTNAGEYNAELTMEKSINLILEDWETEEFNAFDWENNNKPWTITNENSFDGNFSAKSFENLGGNQTSKLSVTINVLYDGVISFYKKVSSEEAYDLLYFKIDNLEMGHWSGEVSWSMEEYEVSAGQHTFSWEYSKDGYANGALDRAWIDLIIFPSYEISDVNYLPEFNSTAITSVYINEEYNYDITALDYNNDELAFSVLEKPDWLNFTDNGNGTANLNGISNNVGDFNVILSVFDGELSSEQEFVINVTTNIANENIVLSKNDKFKIFPNPMKDEAKIYYYLNENSIVNLEIYNILGEKVKTLIKNETQNKGEHFLDYKNNLQSGIYYCKFSTKEKTSLQKIVINN